MRLVAAAATAVAVAALAAAGVGRRCGRGRGRRRGRGRPRCRRKLRQVRWRQRGWLRNIDGTTQDGIDDLAGGIAGGPKGGERLVGLSLERPVHEVAPDSGWDFAPES